MADSQNGPDRRVFERTRRPHRPQDRSKHTATFPRAYYLALVSEQVVPNDLPPFHYCHHPAQRTGPPASACRQGIQMRKRTTNSFAHDGNAWHWPGLAAWLPGIT